MYYSKQCCSETAAPPCGQSMHISYNSVLKDDYCHVVCAFIVIFPAENSINVLLQVVLLSK